MLSKTPVNCRVAPICSRFKPELLIWLCLLILLPALAGCAGEQPPAAARPSTMPSPALASIVTPAPAPTATLAALKAGEWGVVKSGGATVYAEADRHSAVVEQLSPFTLVAFGRKLPDESWWERLGGGWLSHSEVVVYNTEQEARRYQPKPTATPGPVPTYNPALHPTVDIEALQRQIEATVRARPTAPAGLVNPPGVSSGSSSGNIQAPTSYVYYELYGATYEQIYDEIFQKGPIANGERAAGLTEYAMNMRYQYQNAGGKCKCASVEIVLNIKITLPHWNRPNGVSGEFANRVDRYTNSVAVHENTHRNIAIAGANRLYNALSAMQADSCSQLRQSMENTINQISGEMQAEQKRFDADEANHSQF